MEVVQDYVKKNSFSFWGKKKKSLFWPVFSLRNAVSLHIFREFNLKVSSFKLYKPISAFHGWWSKDLSGDSAMPHTPITGVPLTPSCSRLMAPHYRYQVLQCRNGWIFHLVNIPHGYSFYIWRFRYLSSWVHHSDQCLAFHTYIWLNWLMSNCRCGQFP